MLWQGIWFTLQRLQGSMVIKAFCSASLHAGVDFSHQVNSHMQDAITTTLITTVNWRLVTSTVSTLLFASIRNRAPHKYRSHLAIALQ